MPKFIEGNLTKKQELFVDAYFIDFNGTQSAIRAGYAVGSASSTATRLLKTKSVKDAISQRFQDIKDSINSDWLLGNFQQFFLADISKVRSVDDIPAELGKFVKRVEYGQDRDGNETIKIHWMDKDKIADLIGRLIGAFVDKREVNLTDNLGSQIQEARKRARLQVVSE